MVKGGRWVGEEGWWRMAMALVCARSVLTGTL